MKNILMLLLAFLCLGSGIAQDSSNKYSTLPTKLFDKVSNTQQKIANEIQKQNQKMLKLIHTREERLYSKLYSVDSTKANEVFVDFSSKYETFEKKIGNPSASIDASKNSQYVPRMDSLQTMLKFLQPFTNKNEQVEKALVNVEALKMRLAQAEAIKTFLAEREAAIKKLVQLYAKLPGGIIKSLGKYSKEFYYYKERIKGWKESLNHPEKIEETALQLLNKSPAFKTFWQQNSEVAKLFPLPANLGTYQALGGLQTRAQVQSQILQQLGQIATGGDPAQYIRQQMTSAQGIVSQIKDEAAILGKMPSNEEVVMPDFKPNNLKIKSFLRRLEYGFNVQNSQATYLLPTTTDIAFYTGYKFSDNIVAGVGSSGKIGWGKPWKNISLSFQGIGLRSYLDAKTKGNIWLTGGLEYNYQNAFKSYREVLEVAAWQRSGLLGLTRKITTAKKTVKVQFLWDFLSYNQTPRSQVFKFRIGYNF